jgi:hypothetical protein
MHTVAQTRAFDRAAAAAGMSEDEIAGLVDFLAENPAAGEELAGTGGCRKLRVAGRGKGKSGGYRTITFYSGDHIPVFLITVFSKGEKANLSKAERNVLHEISRAIVSEYRGKVSKLETKKKSAHQ